MSANKIKLKLLSRAVFRENDDDLKSDVSSTSQQSYDPLNPNFQDRDGEIGSSHHAKDEQPSTVVLITQRPRPDPGIFDCARGLRSFVGLFLFLV